MTGWLVHRPRRGATNGRRLVAARHRFCVYLVWILTEQNFNLFQNSLAALGDRTGRRGVDDEAEKETADERKGGPRWSEHGGPQEYVRHLPRLEAFTETTLKVKPHMALLSIM